MTLVLHVAQPVDGGVGRYVPDLAAAELRGGLSVVVASPGGDQADRLAEMAVPWRQWRASRSPGPAVAAETRELRRLIDDVGPDVLHLHSSKAGLAGRLAVRGRIPTVFQPHAWSWLAARGAVAFAATRWERYAARWTQAVVCVSEAEHRSGVEHRVRAEFHVVPNGVDLEVFSPVDRAGRQRSRQALGLPEQAPIAVAVGRLDPQKGHDTLIRAWPAVRRSLPDAVLVLVGAGPLRAALEELAMSLTSAGSVVFTGELSDPRAAYAAADVVALSSRWEAMALSPLEAMACGRPVVASDVDGVRESVAAGCGAVVQPGDVEGFAREITARLADPAMAAAEGATARTHAERDHDARRAHDYMLGLTRRLVRPS
jgi:glycosyltransferase involved in cell wall biosynthesis